jgi:hypothetical protein
MEESMKKKQIGNQLGSGVLFQGELMMMMDVGETRGTPKDVLRWKLEDF